MRVVFLSVVKISLGSVLTILLARRLKVKLDENGGVFGSWKNNQNLDNSINNDQALFFDLMVKLAESSPLSIYKKGNVSPDSLVVKKEEVLEMSVIESAFDNWSYIFVKVSMAMGGSIVMLAIFFKAQSVVLRFRKTNKEVKKQLRYNGISVYEVFGYATIYGVVLVLSFFGAFVLDDFFDFVINLLGFLTISSFFSFILSYGIFRGVYLFISSSSADNVFKLIVNDLMNYFLCLLRVFFCFFRYVLYDLQVEYLDIVLQNTDFMELTSDIVVDSLFSLLFFIVNVIIDVVIVLFLIYINCVKFLIALFLFWLIFDLFVFRKFVNSSENEMITKAFTSLNKLVKKIL